jgi:hypothetical protein
MLPLVGFGALLLGACGGSAEPVKAGAGPGTSTPLPDAGSGNSSDAGDGQTCSASAACGTGGATYEECTVFGSTGQCSAIVYKASDGHSFTCAGCASCAGAQQELADYCQTQGSPDGGHDVDAGTHDSGNGATSCTVSLACGSLGATYEECTTSTSDGTCAAAVYQVSGGGPTYTCASCGDCTAALDQVDAYCAGQTPMTTCAAWSACESSSLSYEQCTTSTGDVCQSQYYETTDGHKYACASCGDCSAALSSMDSYCIQETTPVTACSTASPCGAGGATYEQCTTSRGSACESATYTTSTGNKYACASCTDCGSAQLSVQSYCSTLTTTGGVVLFGGFDATGTSLADTWMWNGSTWTAGATGPAARADSLGATLGGQFVVFGGTTSDTAASNLGDTWGWNGSSWSQLTTTGPAARFGSAVASLGSEMVLFGGDTAGDTTGVLADTWLWSGSSWSASSAVGPTARVGAAAAPLDGQIVLFGGLDGTSTYLNDTWIFNGSTWTQMTPATSPSGRFYASAATINNQVVLFGGADAAEFDDTWVWNGSTWTQLTIAGPSARGGAAATSWNGGVVLFGGELVDGTSLADTWIFNGATWTAQTATGPQARNGATMGTVP